jgi:hypothetical protein
MSGTEVTCRDLDTGELEVITVEDDWLMIVDGTMEVTNIQRHTNGTAVITVKHKKE